MSTARGDRDRLGDKAMAFEAVTELNSPDRATGVELPCCGIDAGGWSVASAGDVTDDTGVRAL